MAHETINGWSWCPVFLRCVKNNEGHGPAGTHLCDGSSHQQVSIQTNKEEYVWVVKQNSDLTEGRGPMKQVAVCNSEEEAMCINYSVCGVMGHPAHYGGEVYKVKLSTYPQVEEKVWGHRKGWNGQWGYGWVDNRDAPPEDDPEWQEYQRLKAKFETGSNSHV